MIERDETATIYSACREYRDKTWQNAAERDKTEKDREMSGNTHASRPTTDRAPPSFVTAYYVLSRFVAFTPFYYGLLGFIRTVTAVANFLTV